MLSYVMIERLFKSIYTEEPQGGCGFGFAYRTNQNGFWRFRIDPKEIREKEGWVECAKDDWDRLYVLANWNEQSD